MMSSVVLLVNAQKTIYLVQGCICLCQFQLNCWQILLWILFSVFRAFKKLWFYLCCRGSIFKDGSFYSLQENNEYSSNSHPIFPQYLLFTWAPHPPSFLMETFSFLGTFAFSLDTIWYRFGYEFCFYDKGRRNRWKWNESELMFMKQQFNFYMPWI